MIRISAVTTAFVVARATPWAPRPEWKSVIAAHQRDDETEDRGLDQPRDDVAGCQEVDRRVDVDARREAEPRGADQEPAEDADDVADRGKDRHRDRGGQQARRDQVADRVGREGGQRVDLLGHAHGADLGRDRGGDTARDHQPAEDGAEFAGHGQCNDVGDNGFGVEALAARKDLQRQRAAGEERRHADDRQREIADAQ